MFTRAQECRTGFLLGICFPLTLMDGRCHSSCFLSHHRFWDRLDEDDAFRYRFRLLLSAESLTNLPAEDETTARSKRDNFPHIGR